MSRVVFLFLVMLSALNAIEWLSYEEGLKLQAKNDKVIMIDVIRTECRFCKEMEAEVFDNKEMTEWLQKRFIAVKINLDKVDKNSMPLGITTSFTPSFFFIDKNGKLLKSLPGAWSIVDFKDLTKNIFKDKK